MLQNPHRRFGERRSDLMGLGAVPVGGGRPATGDLDGATAKQNSPPGTVPVQFGIKLAQQPPSHRVCGTKFAQHAPPHSISAKKLAQHA